MSDFAFFRRMSAPDRLQRVYDRAAARWQTGIASLGYPEAYDALCRAALATRPPQDVVTVLDVGTGSGALAAALLRQMSARPDLHLMDLSEQMLATASKLLGPPVHTHLGALGDIHPGQFDVVLCAHVIEHCPDADLALSELHALVKPGGQLILSVSRPHWCTALLRWRWGNAAYHPDDMLDRLARAGFRDTSAHVPAKGPPSRTSCGYLARRAPRS